MGQTSVTGSLKGDHERKDKIQQQYLKDLQERKNKSITMIRSQNIKKWKIELIQMLDDSNSKIEPVDICWSQIKKELISFIKSYESYKDCKWRISAEQKAINSPINSSQFQGNFTTQIQKFNMLEAKEQTATQCDSMNDSKKINIEKDRSISETNLDLDFDNILSTAQTQTRKKTVSDFKFYQDNNYQSNRHIQNNDIDFGVSKHPRKSSTQIVGQIISKKPTKGCEFTTLFSRRSAKKALVKSLHKELKIQNHIVFNMVTIFQNEFKKLFFDQMESNQLPNDNENQFNISQTMQRGQLIVLTFVNVMSEFIEWLYFELIQTLKKGLEGEDLQPTYIIKGIIFDLIFSGAQNQVYDFFITSLSKENQVQLEELKSAMNAKDSDPIDTDGLDSKWQLSEIKNPYYPIIEMIQKISQTPNPHRKFEQILLIDDEIVKYLTSVFQHNEKYLRSLQEGIGMDAIVPITLFSLVQSQNNQLICDLAFINLFIEKDLREGAQNYVLFQACIDFVLQKPNSHNNE